MCIPLEKWIATKEDEQLGKKNGSEMEEDEDKQERARDIIEKSSKCLFRTLKHFLNPLSKQMESPLIFPPNNTKHLKVALQK